MQKPDMKRTALHYASKGSSVPAYHRSSASQSFAAPATTTPDGNTLQPIIRWKTSLEDRGLHTQPQRARPVFRPRAQSGARAVAKMAEQKQQDSATTQDTAMGKNNSSRASSPKPAPQQFHKPKTSQDEEDVYVLTLGLSPSISEPMGQMREEYFPKHLNRTPAHVTLFHALPHSQIEAIKADLENVASYTRPYHVSTGRPFRMRRGVAVMLGSGDEQSQHMREELRERWLEWLSDQDSRVWQPHWTVMNKVDEPKKVEQAFGTIRRILFEDVHHGKAVGLDLWKYQAGDWEWIENYQFQCNGKTPLRTPGSEKGTSYFDVRSQSSRSAAESKNPAIAKKSGLNVAGIWKSIGTRKKGLKPDRERCNASDSQ